MQRAADSAPKAFYAPPAFQAADPEAAWRHVEQFPLALIISAGSEFAWSYAPILRRGDGVVGHLARANPHVARLQSDGRVVLLVCGPQGYVSPSWYVSTDQVPTWNYSIVQLSGTLVLVDEPARLEAILESQITAYEKRFGAGWRLADVTETTRSSLMRAIVGFEVSVAGIDAKFKLNQNKTAADREAVIAALAERDSAGALVANIMRDHLGLSPG